MKWMRGQTIRGRITFWSVAIAIVFTVVAAFAFLAAVDTIVASATKTLLATDGAPYEAFIRAGNTNNLPNPDEEQVIAVVDPKGQVVTSSLPTSLTKRIARLEKLTHGLHQVTISQNLQYDVMNEPVDTTAGEWHIIEARNRASGQVVLNGLKLVLVFGALALVIGFGVASWIVSGVALRPVNRMREQARRLSQASTADTLPVGPVHDELSALAETLNAFITSVRSASDRERQMIADASHELRTPVAVLRTQLQLAHLSSGDAEALEKEITAAEGTLDRLSNLTTNLLTLSRIEAGEAAPETSGGAILTEFYASMDRAIVLGSAQSVSVDYVESDVDPGLTVAIVPADFAGLVDNLVVNAITASPRGERVEVKLTRVKRDLVLSVTDSGHGMPASFLPVAFDRFSRATSSRPRPNGGSGLGLAIVKAIAVRSGGDATIAPRSSGGLVVTVTLPVTKVSTIQNS
jgi:two-component system, OmpR family, sensor kinase